MELLEILNNFTIIGSPCLISYFKTMNTLKIINLNKFIPLIALLLISILLLGGCTPTPPDTESKIDQKMINQEENTPQQEMAEQEATAVKLTPTFLPKPEEIALEKFIKEILQLEISEEKYKEKFKEDDNNIWEIYRVGTIKMPGIEREIYIPYNI